MYVAQYQVSEFEYRSWPTQLERGDFFLIDLRNNENPSGPPDGKPDHGRVIVGYGYTSINQVDYTDGCGNNYPVPPSTYTLLINQHCVDLGGRRIIKKKTGSIGRWSIHIKW
jgi:hypothetical protein